MELRQLEYFLAVSELKSFTKAAEKLFVSQPTITNAISGLEKELNVKLLMRSNRQFALTTEGEVFYNHVKLVMKDVSAAISHLNSTKNRERRTLKLAVSSCLSEMFFLPAYELFLKEHNDARLVFTECTSQNALHQLESEAVDAAIVLDSAADDGPFKKTLISGPMQICFPASKGCESRQLRSELKNGAPVVLCDDSPRLKKQLAARLDIPEESIIARLGSPSSLKNVLARRSAIAIVPDFLNPDMDGYRSETAAPALSGALVFCWRDKESSSGIIADFLSCLTTQLCIKISED